MFQLFGTTDKSGMISNDPIKIIEKPIYNCFNAVLYEKPILNVKGNFPLGI
jgi:hypothetical protein